MGPLCTTRKYKDIRLVVAHPWTNRELLDTQAKHSEAEFKCKWTPIQKRKLRPLVTGHLNMIDAVWGQLSLANSFPIAPNDEGLLACQLQHRRHCINNIGNEWTTGAAAAAADHYVHLSVLLFTGH